jgi:hypothetical protein
MHVSKSLIFHEPYPVFFATQTLSPFHRKSALFTTYITKIDVHVLFFDWFELSFIYFNIIPLLE